MRLATLSALLLLATPAAADPGKGTWIVTELGASVWHANSNAVSNDRAGRGGIDGAGLRVRVGALFGVVPGLAVGPIVGGDTAFTHASSELCCGEVHRVDTGRIGVETAWWPDPRVGFRVLFGFGYAAAATRVDDVGRAAPGVLGAAYPTGSWFSLGLARDTKLGERTRIGGVLRLEADHLTTDSQSMDTFLPSLSLVVSSQ